MYSTNYFSLCTLYVLFMYLCIVNVLFIYLFLSGFDCCSSSSNWIMLLQCVLQALSIQTNMKLFYCLKNWHWFLTNGGKNESLWKCLYAARILLQTNLLNAVHNYKMCMNMTILIFSYYSQSPFFCGNKWRIINNRFVL